MQKKERKQKEYSLEFKLSVILDMRDNHLGYREVIRKYWDIERNKEPNYIHMVQRWERKYLEEGELGLMKDNRGRPSNDGKKRGRPPKLSKQVENDLIAENQRLKEENELLRMEIEYTKKLDALVRAREQKNTKKHK